MNKIHAGYYNGDTRACACIQTVIVFRRKLETAAYVILQVV